MWKIRAVVDAFHGPMEIEIYASLLMSIFFGCSCGALFGAATLDGVQGFA